MIDFTSRKFLGLTLESQHKKCAELIRGIYCKLSTGENIDADLAAYRQLLIWMKEPPFDVVTAKSLSDRYHKHNVHAGVGKKEHNLLPSIRKGDKTEAQPNLPIAIYLDHIRSAHNVGSIVRTVEAFSLGNLYFSDDTPYIDHKQVQDTAMGAQEWVTCYKNSTLLELPRPIIALETSEEAKNMYDFTFPPTFTLVLGNEEYGCSNETLSEADILLEIPLRGRKNSLNVANAFAIAAGEIMRQMIVRPSYS